MALCGTVRVTRLSEFTLACRVVASVLIGTGKQNGGGDVVTERGDGP